MISLATIVAVEALGLKFELYEAESLRVYGVQREHWAPLRRAGLSPTSEPGEWMIEGESVDRSPREGAPVTMYVGTDSYGGKITRVSDSGHKIWFRLGNHKRDRELCASVDTRGRYFVDKHRFVNIGEAIAYTDPHF